MQPDERAYRTHLAGGRFQIGVDAGYWWLEDDQWPNPVIAVSAAHREGGLPHVSMRFDLNGYPQESPTAAPWDVEAAAVLGPDLWPAGGRVGMAFNPGWNPAPGVFAIYVPMDRLALAGHDHWREQHPASLWDPRNSQIVDYLKVIHDLLHSSEYSGTRRAA